jgi:hypothetical protein
MSSASLRVRSSVRKTHVSVTTGTGPISPASNDHPTKAAKSASRWTAGSATEGARRRDQRVLPGSVANLMNPRSDAVR